MNVTSKYQKITSDQLKKTLATLRIKCKTKENQNQSFITHLYKTVMPLSYFYNKLINTTKCQSAKNNRFYSVFLFCTKPNKIKYKNQTRMDWTRERERNKKRNRWIETNQ